jgi:hypothetical protein
MSSTRLTSSRHVGIPAPRTLMRRRPQLAWLPLAVAAALIAFVLLERFGE